jgi:hypothetical protein
LFNAPGKSYNRESTGPCGIHGFSISCYGRWLSERFYPIFNRKPIDRFQSKNVRFNALAKQPATKPRITAVLFHD